MMGRPVEKLTLAILETVTIIEIYFYFAIHSKHYFKQIKT